MRRRREEFPERIKEAVWARAGGACEACGLSHDAAGDVRFHVDHIVPAALGGKPVLENGRLLCPRCHRAKTKEHDTPKIAKASRLERKRRYH
jgi:5-methylcytosine-specific restriction endonuclease McrA